MKKIFPYHWLTAADFTRNGGIKGLQRYGKQASGTYGYVDNLTISYSGNRISGVSDGAPVVTQNGSMDFPGGSTSSLFSYNTFGALTADPSRGITSITYDNFGNPTKIQFSNGRNITNVYSATGEKLKTSNQVGVLASADAASPFDMEMGLESASSEDVLSPQAVVAQSSISYHGPIIYRNSTVDKVLFPGGYATISGTTVTFHYYTQDYLGNNRAVINGSTGATEQTIAYYPFGAVIADLGTPTTGQPYKFGGKELLTTNGLNEYDFGARNYYSAVPGFTKSDPLCEDTQHLSPYLYCANNPVNLIDPSGKIIEMPEESTVGQIFDVWLNLQKITDDKLTFSAQDDGSIRISIQSRGKGRKITGTNLVRRLTSSSRTLTINVIDHGGNYQSSEKPADASNGIGTNTRVYFNPDSNPDIMEVDPKTNNTYYTKRPTFMGLTHELRHADRSMRGIAFDNRETEFHAFTNENGEPDVEEIPKEEAATIGFNHVKWFGLSENRIRKEMGLNPRGAYYSRRRR